MVMLCEDASIKKARNEELIRKDIIKLIGTIDEMQSTHFKDLFKDTLKQMIQSTTIQNQTLIIQAISDCPRKTELFLTLSQQPPAKKGRGFLLG